MREMLSSNLTLKLDVETIKSKLKNNDKNVELLFSYLDELMAKENSQIQKGKEIERTKIGYKK